MKILDVVQGTSEWHAARRQYPRTASKAPAMMNASKYTSRAELLRNEATGSEEDISPAKQALFDRGHETEDSARAIVEEMIGEDLYPMTATDDSGYLLASSDGATMMCETGYEHKLWNEEAAALVSAGEVPEAHKWQLDQQCAVFGFEKVIFVVSDGTREKFVSCEYRTTPERISQLLAGWKQFDEDLASYQHVESAPAAVAAPIEDLPALTVELVGQVTRSNLDAFKVSVLARIEAINTDLQTDNDFATAEKTVKFLDDGEKRLTLVKQQALSQTATIDELFRAIDHLQAEMKSKRLTLDKLVKARKDSIRVEIMAEGRSALSAHMQTLSKRIGMPMPDVAADFAGAMKGKKSVSSLRDAVATELARAKIAANEIADKIQINLISLAAVGSHAFLFNDRASLVLKANDDLQLVIKTRIADHQAAEEKRLADERERIRAEEEAKAQRKAADDAAAKIEADRKAAAPEPATQPVGAAQDSHSGRPIAPAAVAAPTHSGITGTGRIRDLIDDALRDFNAGELRQALDAIDAIKASRRVAA